MSDKEAVQRTDCDTKGDIAKVKELSVSHQKMPGLNPSESPFTLLTSMHCFQYLICPSTEIEKATYPCDLERLRCVFTLIKNKVDFNNVTLI